MAKKSSGYAIIGVKPGWGYTVFIFKGTKMVKEYSAGDAHGDSQVYGTGQVSGETLAKFARGTAEEMMGELGLSGKIKRDDSIAADEVERWQNPDDEDEVIEEEDDFDLREEMREGGVISDRTRGGYEVSLSGKYLGQIGDYDEALELLVQKMEDEKYYPNIFFVNDHGNVDLIWVKPKMRKGKVIKVESKIIRSWV